MLRTQIVICGGTGCLSSKSQLIKDEFKRVLKEFHLEDEVYLYMSGCFGLCEKGPVVIVYPDQVFMFILLKMMFIKLLVNTSSRETLFLS